MRKIFKIFTLSLSAILLTGCFGSGGSSSGSSSKQESGGSSKKETIELTGVELVASKTSCLTGESVACSFNPIPSNANSFNGKAYDAKCIEYWVDGVQLSSRETTYTYIPKEMGEHSVIAYYCNHSGDCNHVGDIESNKITLNVDLPESEKVLFKYNNLNDGTIEIYAGKLIPTIQDLVIPSEIDGKVVSKIANQGFKNCTSLKTIKFERNISRNFKIGQEAFIGCSSLERVLFPLEVTDVGQDCFKNCGTDVIFYVEHDTNPSGYSNGNYGHYPWYGSGSVYNSVINYFDTEDYYFVEDTNNKINIIKYIGSDSTLKIPEKFNDKDVVRIRIEAFKGCTRLKEIEFPSTIRTINAYAFAECTQLKKLIINEGCEFLADNVFNGCSSMHLAYIPNSVTSLGQECFKNCNENLIIFLGHNSTNPSGFSSGNYGHYPWYGSAKLRVCDCEEFIEEENYIFSHNIDDTITICEYLGRDTDLVLPEKINAMNVTEIACNVFKNQNRIKTIVFPNTLTKIYSNAFDGCSALTSMVLPSSLVTIMGEAFANCSALTKLIIPTNVKNIGINAFDGCPNLELYVESATRPSGFEVGRYSHNPDWNSGVKMTYYGVGNGWFLDEQGNPYHL